MSQEIWHNEHNTQYLLRVVKAVWLWKVVHTCTHQNDHFFTLFHITYDIPAYLPAHIEVPTSVVGSTSVANLTVVYAGYAEPAMYISASAYKIKKTYYEVRLWSQEVALTVCCYRLTRCYDMAYTSLLPVQPATGPNIEGHTTPTQQSVTPDKD